MGWDRHQFTDEFKTEAIALLAGSGRRLVEIAAELGISPSMPHNWRNRQGGQHAGSGVPRNRRCLPSFDPAAGSPGLAARTIGCARSATFQEAVAIFWEVPRRGSA